MRLGYLRFFLDLRIMHARPDPTNQKLRCGIRFLVHPPTSVQMDLWIPNVYELFQGIFFKFLLAFLSSLKFFCDVQESGL